MPFPKGDLIASIIAAGEKPSWAAIAVDELLPELTDEELLLPELTDEELEKVLLYIYALLSPAERQEALHEVELLPAVQALDGS